MGEIKKCVICGDEYEARKANAKPVCSKSCRDKLWRQEKKENVLDRRFRRNKRGNKRGEPNPAPTVSEGILLDSQLIKAVKRSVAKEIIKVIEERYI